MQEIVNIVSRIKSEDKRYRTPILREMDEKITIIQVAWYIKRDPLKVSLKHRLFRLISSC